MTTRNTLNTEADNPFAMRPRHVRVPFGIHPAFITGLD